jgi:hypothetical protein
MGLMTRFPDFSPIYPLKTMAAPKNYRIRFHAYHLYSLTGIFKVLDSFLAALLAFEWLKYVSLDSNISPFLPMIFI